MAGLRKTGGIHQIKQPGLHYLRVWEKDKMRDLLFKNFTSGDKKRRILTSSEITDKEGMRSTIHRHFVCIVKEIESKQVRKPKPYLYVLKARNKKEQVEKFFCRLKGSLYAVNKGQLYLILFMHSLKINIRPIPSNSFSYQ